MKAKEIRLFLRRFTQRHVKTMAPNELSLALTSYEWDRAVTLVQQTPVLAKTWNVRLGFFEGRTSSTLLPLHEASGALAPVRVADAILRAYPEATHCQESAYKRLPLHCACRRNADPAVIKLLLQAHAPACLVPDALGRLPLHYALSNGADPVIINMLLDCCPECAKGMDSRGWTPLHVACSVGACTSVITRLLELYPEAAIIRTSKGSSATGLLHRESVNRDEVKALLKQARADFDRTFVNPLRARARPALEDMILV